MLALLLLIGLLAVASASPSSSSQTEAVRQTRSDVRTMMDKLDPNFWPTRGRRSSSSEETPPPFWANRGRAIEELETILAERGFQPVSDETAPPFWAHRGREIICPEKGTMKNPLSVEEPRWVMFNRRDAEEPLNDDALWISQGPHGGLDGLNSREHEFWVSRGKKMRNEKKDTLRALLSQEDFYPTRGKRSLQQHQ